MKYIYSTTLVCFLAIASLAQNSDRLWMMSGPVYMNKSLSSISQFYGDEQYNLVNTPSVKAEFFASDSWYKIDMSGFFYWVIGLNKQNTENAAFNIQTRTSKSMEQIQDRLGLEFMSTKMKNPSTSYNYGFGKQIGFGAFGFTDKPLLKTGLTIEPPYPDPGPYSYRQMLRGGFNFQFFKSWGEHVGLRVGLVANALVGIKRYGAMAYPEAALRLSYGRIGIFGVIAHETYYLYTPSEKLFAYDYAKTSAVVQGLRYEINIALDIHKK
jgi:hypothetical protein